MSATPILAQPPRSDRLVVALAHLALTCASRTARELRIRRDMRRLAELDDAMLRDIGIARTEIELAVRAGRTGLLSGGF
jgi:uncharacterized protein YjiS (DUF1127 family)